MTVDPRLLEILVCPACSAVVRETDEGDALTCEGCRRSFPVHDATPYGIPSMLVEEDAAPERSGSGG